MNDSVKTSLKRTLVGKVVSNKMDKTVTVLVEHQRQAPDLRQVRRTFEEVPRAR